MQVPSGKAQALQITHQPQNVWDSSADSRNSCQGFYFEHHVPNFMWPSSENSRIMTLLALGSILVDRSRLGRTGKVSLSLLKLD
jgi:hypothetical protein